MGYFITVLYVSLAFLSPADLFPSLAPYRIMLLLSAMASIAALLAFLTGSLSLRIPQVPLLIGLFMMVVISRPLHGWFGGGFEAMMEFIIPVVTFCLVIANVNTEKRLRQTIVIFICLNLYLAFRGIHSYHTGFEAYRWLVEQRIDPNSPAIMLRVRATGFLGDPNDFAQTLLVAIALLGLFWKKHAPVRNLMVVGIPVLFLGYCLFLTASRGALIGVFVMFALMLRRKLGILGPVVSAGLTTFLLVGIGFGGGRVFSMKSGTGAGRLEIWSEALALFFSSPLYGVGYDSFTRHSRHTAHNSFVLCFTELGIIGYVLWLGLIVVTMMQLTRAPGILTVKVTDNAVREAHQKLARTLLMALWVFLATSWFLSRTYVLTLYVLLAMGTSYHLIARVKEAPEESDLPPHLWIRKTALMTVGTILAVYVMVRLRWS